MPDGDWLTPTEAGDQLGISAERVRQLIKSGQLPGRRGSGGWLVPASALSNVQPPGPGRRASPQTAWSVIAILAAAQDGTPHPENVIPDRAAIQRLLKMIAALPDPPLDTAPWKRLLAARGRASRMWVHPGVLPNVQADERVSPGGSEAMPPEYGLTRGHVVLYAADADADAVTRQYRLRTDHTGQVTLVAVPAAQAPRGGASVPAPAAAADLLDEASSRARYAATTYLADCCRALRSRGLI